MNGTYRKATINYTKKNVESQIMYRYYNIKLNKTKTTRTRKIKRHTKKMVLLLYN